MISKRLRWYLSSSLILVAASSQDCKCTPNDSCWPSSTEWATLNTTLGGALIRGIPPASVCYPSQPDYSSEACAFVHSQWFNSTWHAAHPISIDYPVWTNNSCNPIYENGTSVTGDLNAGKKGCSIGKYPVYAVKVTQAKQISDALKWAAARNLRVVVKGTGHSYPGRSTGYGSLSIWTHNLRGITYIPSFKPESCSASSTFTAVRVAAGQTGIEVQIEMARHSSIIVTGANPDVGLVGWITGGGHGPLSTTYGMGADNLLEATVVTPSGEVLLANPCKNTDIFYAIRGGGGGTFGVVTEVVIKTYPSPKVTQNQFVVSTTGSSTSDKEFWNLMAFIHAEFKNLKKGGMQGYYYMVGPPAYPVLAMTWGFLLYDKPIGTVERLLAPIVLRLTTQALLFQYSSVTTFYNTFIDVLDGVTNEAVADGGSAYGSWLMSPESLSNTTLSAEVLSKFGPTSDATKPSGIFYNPVLIGHMIASPNLPSYYPNSISMNPAWRKTLTHLIVVEGWPDGIAQSLIDSVYRNVTEKVQRLRDLSPETGAYFNEPDSYEPQWQHAFFGQNYARLLEIKKKVDPGNLLWCSRCVGSEALVEAGDGRLCRSGS
ncbi:FAD-binding domain-containing protein [Massarina eburnea CBS 473.64]|uniref:FAD-binding domain-containing protein n=1 Tax=Massarina eburnea CBS 473.64 TaxID=1395130 RepID=A0A6A6RWD3_9PLEO|nr:FAD-binding domain-containing protein [Massarina eburnea CBS 473.64]